MSSQIGLRTLILNADMMPTNLLTLKANPVEDAICRILNETCVMLDAYPRGFKRSEFGGTREYIPVPSVMYTKKYFQRPEILPLHDNYLLLRDGFQCVYCGMPLNEDTMTWDHYIPESKGGLKTWGNILSSCSRCNHSYGDTPASKKKPKHKPYTPSYGEMVSLRRKRPIILDHKTWVPWIGKWSGDVIVLDKG
jgi:hypothetical protein